MQNLPENVSQRIAELKERQQARKRMDEKIARAGELSVRELLELERHSQLEPKHYKPLLEALEASEERWANKELELNKDDLDLLNAVKRMRMRLEEFHF